MPELYRIHEAPELIDPVLIVGLDGWIDAGYAAANAVGTMLEGAGYVTIASFDTDVLLDHRARRPTCTWSTASTPASSWPSLELRAGIDASRQRPAPAARRRTRSPVEGLHRGGARPGPGVRHARSCRSGPTRPPCPTPGRSPCRRHRGIVRAGLRVGTVRGRVDVPAGVQAVLETAAAESGIPAIGLWAQVPHY